MTDIASVMNIPRQIAFAERTRMLVHSPPASARVAKLADALDLGSCTLIGVGVRLPPLAIYCFPMNDSALR